MPSCTSICSGLLLFCCCGKSSAFQTGTFLKVGWRQTNWITLTSPSSRLDVPQSLKENRGYVFSIKAKFDLSALEFAEVHEEGGWKMIGSQELINIRAFTVMDKTQANNAAIILSSVLNSWTETPSKVCIPIFPYIVYSMHSKINSSVETFMSLWDTLCKYTSKYFKVQIIHNHLTMQRPI